MGILAGGIQLQRAKTAEDWDLDDLVADAERRGLPFTREEIKAAVRLYAESYGYVLAMSEGPERFSLTGDPAETTKADREWARVRLTWKRYRKAKKKRPGQKKLRNRLAVSPVHSYSRAQNSPARF